MAPRKSKDTYNNMLDFCFDMEENLELQGNGTEMFRTLCTDYFFKYEKSQSKSMELYFKNYSVPDFIKDAASIVDVDIEAMRSYIEGNMVNDSFAGKIFFSKEYLKTFYSNHPPDYSKLPSDLQMEIIDGAKNKNAAVLSAFEKMYRDIEVGRKRTVKTLIALVLKNIYMRTSSPLANLPQSAEKIIGDLFVGTEKIFIGANSQMAELNDDKKVKDLVKTFFMVKKFQDITDIADQFKKEIKRYQRRALKLGYTAD